MRTWVKKYMCAAFFHFTEPFALSAQHMMPALGVKAASSGGRWPDAEHRCQHHESKLLQGLCRILTASPHQRLRHAHVSELDEGLGRPASTNPHASKLFTRSPSLHKLVGRAVGGTRPEVQTCTCQKWCRGFGTADFSRVKAGAETPSHSNQ